GRDPPDPRWPGGARIAVQFVLNYEEGGERNILHGDATSEAFLSDVLGATPWPGARHMNVESMYEYGSRAGFWRLWRVFTRTARPGAPFRGAPPPGGPGRGGAGVGGRGAGGAGPRPQKGGQTRKAPGKGGRPLSQAARLP